MELNYRKYLIYLVLFIVSVILVWYFSFENGGKTKYLFDAIPVNSTLIVECQQTGPIWKKLTSETNYWESLSQIPTIKQLKNEINKLDSLLVKIPDFRKSMNQKPMALILHKGIDGYGFVFLAETGKDLKYYEIEPLLQQTFGSRITFVEQKLGGYQSGLIVDGTSEDQFNFLIVNGLFICSYQKNLVELCLQTLNNPINLMQDSSFVALRRTTGTKVDAHVYVNDEQISDILAFNSSEIYKSAIEDLSSNFARWTVLDLSLKPDILHCVGYSSTNETDNFLNIYKNQQPTPVSIYKLLPYTTKIFLHNSVNNFVEYNDQITDKQLIAKLSDEFQFDFKTQLINQIEAETILAFGDNPNDPVFIARIHDQNSLAQALSEFKSQFLKSEPNRDADDLTFSQIPIDNLVPLLFGNQYNRLTKFYYVLIDNYLIVANNFYRLEELSRFYHSGRTLALNENFISFKNNLSDEANYTFYCNLRDGLIAMDAFIDPVLYYHLNRNIQVLKQFEAFAIQFSVQEDLFYTNIFLKYNPNYKEESLLVWSKKFDDLLIGKPSVLYDKSSGTSYITAFDASNKIYFLSSGGDILWKHQLDSEQLGDVYVVENQKDKFGFIFNTENYIYAFDKLGNQKGSFPVRLKSQATNSITIANEDDPNEGQIVVSCSDRYTYSFDLKGNPIQNWEKPKSLEIVTKPVEFLPTIDRSYFIINDIKGNIRIADMNGRIRITPKGIMKRSANNHFYVNKTNAKGVMLSTDNQGNILYVAANGQLNHTDFVKCGSEHYFFYEDFKRNNSTDFIFIDGAKLQVFDRFKKVLFTYNFKSEIDTQPWYKDLSNGKRFLIINDTKNDEVFLFDNDGKMIISSGLIGNHTFDIGCLGSSAEMNLITIKDSTVYNYLVY